MKPGKSLSAWVLLVLCVAENAHSGNILVWYTEGSHWINLKPVLETLVDRGHQVTVLIPSTSMYMDANTPSRFSYEPFNVSMSIHVLEGLLENILHFSMYEMDHASYLQVHMRFMDLVKKHIKFMLQNLDDLLKSDDVMRRLKEAKYDVLLADPIYVGSELMAEILDIPLVYTLRFSMAHTWERLCGQLPAPSSYVPGPMSQLTDKINFRERVYNFFFYAYQDALFYSMWQDVDKYYTDFKGKPTTLCEMSGRADIWLMRTYWDFDFPRPFLPNFKFVGGIHCSPAKPLPEDMEEFVQSSGEAGIVVFTLGSIIKNLTEEKANIIASALAQIPQKVIWRFSGEKPKALGSNTKIYPWIPQNDLLGTLLLYYSSYQDRFPNRLITLGAGHPKTRAFITHGGTNGIYEAIYHGVPMVGIPIFGDQPDNMVHMKAKGATLSLHYNSMETQDLVNALNTVINEPSYKQRVMQLSQIHHDRPISPRDEAVFWIEFTMRNRGAKHLRVQAHELTWYQYHSLDTAGFLLTVCLVLVLLFIKTCGFCIRKCCGRTKKRKSKAE